MASVTVVLELNMLDDVIRLLMRTALGRLKTGLPSAVMTWVCSS